MRAIVLYALMETRILQVKLQARICIMNMQDKVFDEFLFFSFSLPFNHTDVNWEGEINFKWNQWICMRHKMLTNSLKYPLWSSMSILSTIYRFPTHKNIYLILLQVEEEKIAKTSNKNFQPFLTDDQIQQNSCT